MARILIVDDDPSTRILLKRMLESSPDTDVVEAGDGAEGLDRAQETHPDLILLDIQMPKMTGIDFLEVRMGSEELSRIPVVVISVLSERSNVVAAVSRGACGYVTKPFDPRGLQSKVADLLRSRTRA
jgi:two-component system chemotaxis response regulator CheY